MTPLHTHTKKDQFEVISLSRIEDRLLSHNSGNCEKKSFEVTFDSWVSKIMSLRAESTVSAIEIPVNKGIEMILANLINIYTLSF